MKLNDTVRRQIVRATLRKTYEKRRLQIEEMKSELFTDLHRALLPADFIRKTKGIPVEWLARLESIRVSGAGRNVEFTGSASFPYNLLTGNGCVYVKAEDLTAEFKKRVLDFRDYSNRVDEDEKDLQSATLRVVNSVTTVKRLKEVWPEVVNFYELNDQGQNLPAIVSAGALNELIAKHSSTTT